MFEFSSKSLARALVTAGLLSVVGVASATLATGNVTANTNLISACEVSAAGAVRVGVDGSVGWLDGLPFATRRIDQRAFAVVRVGDLEGVPVSRSNQAMAATISRGQALVPGLLPYQKSMLERRELLAPASARSRKRR